MKCKECKKDMELHRPVFESSIRTIEELSYFWCEGCQIRIDYEDAILGVNE